ncbi:hypothetical protein ABK040_011919 [Willaertia magna]
MEKKKLSKEDLKLLRNGSSELSQNDLDLLGETYYGAKIFLNKVGSDGRSIFTSESGGYLFTNEEEIKEQRNSIWEMVRKLGSALLEGKDLVSVSLPVYVFEPRSFLQRLPDLWCFHRLLNQASEEVDPVNRFVKVIGFAVSGLHQMCIAKKPFNPILGETFEAEFVHENNNEKDIKVYLEQTSHHPPITAYELTGESFRMHGYCGYLASIRGNALKGGQTGPTYIDFKDGSTIEYDQPFIWLKGVCWGQRILDYYGKMTFTDKKNGLSCDLVFNPDEKGFISSFFSSQKTPSDFLRGEIKKNDKVIGVVEGSWLGIVQYFADTTIELLEKNSKSSKYMNNLTKQEVFNIGNLVPKYAKPSDDPLPSDSRFRQDAIFLAQGDVKKSQEWKEILENKQRKERQLRKSGSSKSSLSNGNGSDSI